MRTGLATGEAELRDGDYFGTVLNRAARVMSASSAIAAYAEIDEARVALLR